MKSKRPGIHNFFYVFSIIQAIAGGIGAITGIIIIEANNGELITGLVVIGIGLVALLLAPFVFSWGVVVEKICCINDNTELLTIGQKVIIGQKQSKSEEEKTMLCNDSTTLTRVSKAIQGEIIVPSNITNIDDFAFAGCILTDVAIPNSIKTIGIQAFTGCINLTNITYQGTIAEWNAINKGECWDSFTGNYTIHCTDGDIAK